MSELVIKRPVRTGRIVAGDGEECDTVSVVDMLRNTKLELDVHPPVPIDIVQLRAKRTDVSR